MIPVNHPSRVVLACLLLLPAAARVYAQSDTWVHRAPQPTSFNLSDIQMLSATEAFAVGSDEIVEAGIILHTQDGGQTWDANYPHTNSVESVFFLDSQRGWAAGNGFFRTVNGPNIRTP